jgi:hypothetical protein
MYYSNDTKIKFRQRFRHSYESIQHTVCVLYIKEYYF